MAIKDEKGNWIDSDGRRVPPRYIAKIEKSTDKRVAKLFKMAEEANKRLVTLKKAVEDEFAAYLLELTKACNELDYKGSKCQLVGFSHDKRVVWKIGKFIDFDDRLQIAKQKVDRCIERWSEGANDKLRVVVYEAFQVDTKGRVDTKRILGLRKLEIVDKEWQEAMELISKAVTVVATKSYFYFEHREPGGAWQTLHLHLARV